MKYIELIEILKKDGYKKILVTGPQRSGTRFTTNVIGNDLNIDVIDELDYGINNPHKLKNIIQNKDGFVAQGPAISHLIDTLPDDICIVFMYRPIGDILKSQSRINWKSGIHEPAYKGMYRSTYGNLSVDWKKPLAQVKYEIWEKYQKPKTKKTCFDLDYESLSVHEMWKEKLQRKNFKANQIK